MKVVITTGTRTGCIWVVMPSRIQLQEGHRALLKGITGRNISTTTPIPIGTSLGQALLYKYTLFTAHSLYPHPILAMTQIM